VTLKIVLKNASDELLSLLRGRFPDVELRPWRTPEEELREVVDADAYYGQLSREAFVAARKLRWVHEPGTSIDRYRGDVPEMADSDVVLTNARGPHVQPMADHGFAMLLALTHRIPELWEDKKAARWDGRQYNGKMVDLVGKKMGILAMGDLGVAVARRAVGFGLTIYGVDVQPVAPPPGVEAVWGPDRLDDLLKLSDVFVVTAPLTAKTRGLVDRRRVELLPQGAFVIVLSRGNIVDEPALLEGVRSGRLGGAGLDVTSVEPLPPDNPLWAEPRILISPHCSASTPGVLPGRHEIYAENLRRFLAGEPFLYVCNKKEGY
jgi:phosphoglycerate dehydrogenase-like enzyme